MSSIHEECGVFGIISPTEQDLASIVYYGLYALQHRGQESCGIVVNDDGVFASHKDIGLVSEVFTKEVLSSMPKGKLAIGHARYGTQGGNNRNNCQPLEVNHQKGKMAISLNGSLSNGAELRSKLELTGAIFHTTSDTEVIAYLITKERLTAPTIEEAIFRAMKHLDGAYCLVVMSPQKLICARDPYGFHPLCYGKMADGSLVISSETCALGAVGAEFIADVKPGELIVLDGKEIKSRQDYVGTKPKKICCFEHVYFARPDSVVDGMPIHSARMKAGEILAKYYPVEADIVVGVPDSGLDAALGYSKASGIPYEIGLLKNKYIGRTFIAPGQDCRLDKVRIKLSAIESAVKGKRVVLIDDSIVRGTTSGRLVKILKDAGAKEIHMRVSAPPFIFPCYYGTDIDSQEHLIACKYSVDEIAKIIGVDSLGYFPIEEIKEMVGDTCYCDACFNGNYPTAVPTETKRDKFEQKLSQKSSK